ncbi:transposase, partial [Colletotrichum incanum]
NPSIKVQRSRSINSRRVNGASAKVIRDWFKYLAIPAIMAIKPANRYNMDETGILKGKGSNGLVLGRAKTKSVRKKQPGSRAWEFTVTENGWTTDETAVTWLKRVFLPQTAPSQSAYRKELRYLSQWNDLTIIGKRNFISCYQKARLAGVTAQNIKSGWKYTGLW